VSIPIRMRSIVRATSKGSPGCQLAGKLLGDHAFEVQPVNVVADVAETVGRRWFLLAFRAIG